jgi:hypothetical protein
MPRQTPQTETSDAGEPAASDAPVRGVSREAVLAIAWLFVVALAIVWVCRQRTGGALVYALDDAYIHLAMARTLAEHGLLGVTEQTPAAASSSPLWTAALAGLTGVFGVSKWYPLILNALAASALVLVSDRVLAEQFQMRGGQRFMTLVVLLLVGPVIPLMMTGMEHVAHAAAVVGTVWYALRADDAAPAALFGLGALATGLRYESIFVIVALVAVLLARRRWSQAGALVAGGAVLILGVGLYQVHMGHRLLPNSLLVKAVPGASLSTLALSKISAAMANAQLAALPMLALSACFAAILLGFRRVVAEKQFRVGDRLAVEWVFVLTSAILLHWTLASLGWFDRYEAYLVLLGAMVVVGLFNRALRGIAWATVEKVAGRGQMLAWRMTAVVAYIVLLLPYASRIDNNFTVLQACDEIHQQHQQMARFVASNYNRSSIAINDIGYVSFLSEARLLDLWGLATLEVADAIREGRMDEEFVAALADRRDVEIAVLYEADYIPEQWDHIASWSVGERLEVAAEETVHFYAVEPDAAPRLARQLREFEPSLPEAVEVEYYRDAAADARGD